MYAVVNTGGKQYRLTEGARVEVERCAGEVGDQVVFDQVLFVGDADEQAVGSPVVEGARVVGTIVEQCKGDKIVVFKYKKRKMYRRRTGHRQLLTRVQIDEIQPDGKSRKAEPKAAARSKAKTSAKATAAGASTKDSPAAPAEDASSQAAPSAEKSEE